MSLSSTSGDPIEKKTSRSLFSRHALFICTVILPVVFAVFYFGMIASKVYVTESTFVVRNLQQQSPSGLGSILQSTGLASLSQSQEDLYAVSDFITSRDALKELNDRMNLMDAWSSPKIDLLQQFAPLGLFKNFEHLYLYYQKRVTVEVDSKSNLCTMTVRGFSAEQSKEINEILLQAAERLVNKLNERARQDMVGFAVKEVVAAQDHVKDAALKMTEEVGKVAGNEGLLSAKDAQYQLLLLEREFAKEQLSSANVSLQSARNEAQRQQLYLEVVAKPVLPDTAMEPRRIRSVLVTLIVGLIAWGIFTMLFAGVKEHQL
jgi:capsular polysaccharide transport system permease protein